MVKKSLIQRSLKKYNLIHSYLLKHKILKSQLKSTQKILSIFKLKKYIQCLPKNSNFTRFNHFCFKTGRNKGYYRDFGLSRHIIRELAYNCELPGLLKSSW